MAFNVLLANTAESDLLEIAEYIATDNPSRAIAFVKEIETHLKNQLSEFPKTGVQLEELEIRKISFRGYTSFYKIESESKTVYILRIINLGKPLKARGIEF